MAAVRLIDADLPDFGVPAERPELSRQIYSARFEALAKARARAGIDALVLYADREHSANLSWLTGFDPRFEEALMIVVPARTPTLLAGPENLARAGRSAIDADVRLYPPFGLLGQNRAATPALDEVLRSAGIESGQRVGVLGWKYFGPSEAAKPDTWLETPAFIADTLRAIVGTDGRVGNANALLMHAGTGLRAVNEVEQIAQFEFGAVMASESVKGLLRALQPGMSEYEAAQAMGLGVLPHSCHTMLSTGVRHGRLESPTGKIIEFSEPLTTAVGYPGGLSARAGWVVADRSGLPASARDYVEKLAAPYFAAAADWYETIAIGVTGGTLDAAVRDRLGAAGYGLLLNPGHLIHLDAWLNTPVYAGSTEKFVSGQAVQCDIIPVVGAPYYGINIEDGIALLDARGRGELAEKFPALAQRIAARRDFMIDILGIRIGEDVLPLSNLAGALPPYLLSPTNILSRR